MKINYLELVNYRKFEHVKLEMPDGVIGIIGRNGVGKSTLVEAMAWALFGNESDIVREKKESIRRAGVSPNEPTRVIVEFTYANDDHRVTREMSGSRHLVGAILEINGKKIAEGAEEVTKEIERKIGMDYKSFFISVFARQKELAALSALKESERKRLIMRMLRIDMLEDVISRISSEENQQRKIMDYRRKDLIDEQGKPRIASIENRRNELAKQIEEHEQRMGPISKRLEELIAEESRLDARSHEIDDELKELNARKNAFEKKQTDLQAKKGNLEEANRRLERARAASASAKNLDDVERELEETRRDRDYQLAARKDAERLESLQKEIRQIGSKLKKVEDEILRHEDSIRRLKAELKDFDKMMELERTAQSELEELKERASVTREKKKTLEREVQKDKKHLEEIRTLGPDSKCPTCDRLLGEHYEELMCRLEESVSKGGKDFAMLSDEIMAIDREIDKKNGILAELRRSLESLREQKEKLAAAEKVREHKIDEGAELAKRLDEKLSEARELQKMPFDASSLESLESRLKTLEVLHGQLLSDSALAREVPELEEKCGRLSEEIAELERELSATPFDQTEIELLEASREELGIRRRELRQERESISKELGMLKETRAGERKELENLDSEIARLRNFEAELKRLEEDQMYLSKLKEIMNEFKGNLIARIVPTLSQYASDLISQMTDGRYANLLLDDDYNISIEDDGKAYGIKRYSGGETDLANLCLRLAISKVIAETSYTEGVNLLVLDEIFGSQDLERKRLLLSAFSTLSRQFRQIILITHIEDIKEQLGALLEVYEDEHGVSHVRAIS